MPNFRDLEARITRVVFDHLGDETTYTFASGGTVTTRVQVYEKANIAKDDSVRGLSAATSRQFSAAETVTMASLQTVHVPAPKKGDSFPDSGVTYYVEAVLERTPSRVEVMVRRG